MNDTGQGMRATLLAGSDDVPPGIDLLRGVREQAAARRRHRRRMRVLVPAGAVAGVVAVAATLLGTSVANPPSALAAVTSAMVKTSAQSYRFSMNGSLTLPSIGLTQHFALTGAIDPQHERGTELVTGGPLRGTHTYVTEQLRFIGKNLYTWVSPASGVRSVGKPWDEAPIPAPDTRASPGSELRGNTFEQPISPAELLGALRSAAAVRYVGPASGPGWTGSKYGFTADPGRHRCWHRGRGPAGTGPQPGHDHHGAHQVPQPGEDGNRGPHVRGLRRHGPGRRAARQPGQADHHALLGVRVLSHGQAARAA
jgi:hypothetical protein